MRGRKQMRLLGYGLLAALALTGGGCAAVLIGGAVAAGGAGAYAYYKGDMHLDFPAEFNQTWAASLAALPDLGMPILEQSLTGDHGEIESRGPDGEKVSLYLEPLTVPDIGTRVHIRVGIFGHQAVSQQIHTQISSRLQNPAPVAPGTPGATPAGGAPGSPSAPPPGVALPKETAPPPLAGPAETVIPVSGSASSGTIAIPVSTAPAKSSAK